MLLPSIADEEEVVDIIDGPRAVQVVTLPFQRVSSQPDFMPLGVQLLYLCLPLVDELTLSIIIMIISNKIY